VACRVPGGSGLLTLTESNNGATVTIAPGDRVQVVLPAASWAFDAPPAGAVLVAQGIQATARGAVTQVYAAEGQGSVVLKAHRTSCVPGVGCSAIGNSFSVTVVVRIA
jgi:hypothetical protein